MTGGNGPGGRYCQDRRPGLYLTQRASAGQSFGACVVGVRAGWMKALAVVGIRRHVSGGGAFRRIGRARCTTGLTVWLAGMA